MKSVLLMVAFLTVNNLNGQWAFNAGQPTGIETSSNSASGPVSIAMGFFTNAAGNSSTSMGNGTSANGDNSTAIGINTVASGYATVTMGAFNTIDFGADPSAFKMSNRALVIGNGTSSGSKSDALTILFDGTTTIAGDLTVNSDVRLKSHIQSLGNTLPLLNMLDGKSYFLKTDQSNKKIGLLAQDVLKVFPELVRKAKDPQSTLSVNYQGLIPVLINAVNEQQSMIQEYESRFNKQQQQIDHLTTLVNQLLKKK